MAGVKGRSGGKREGAGRKVGAVNRITHQVRALARAYGPGAIDKLAQMAGLTDQPPALSEIIQISAIKELLDRGFGKVVQPLTNANEDGAPILIITGVRREPPMLEAPEHEHDGEDEDDDDDEVMISTGISTGMSRYSGNGEAEV